MALSLEGLSYKEIAEVTGISANNVGVMINRIKNDLQGQMQHDS
jgi:DNA-directed RNA polymerase specialized sigma24 family protein